ncbi:hypothetical protein OG896_38365 [Streptomyces sp. NBC_00669]|uniref:hypothetical protein n=1 Tax=Streptomyces sp. NBC_00669 TaxID=2976011 RepID=UPI002E32E3D9|nr:hypothetical protein [Streptomyces sp. NBC_00669]
MAGPRATYLKRTRRPRNADSWLYADSRHHPVELRRSGAALARVAAHPTDRVGARRSLPAGRVRVLRP